MQDATPNRRRSPLWLRQSSSQALHGIGGRFLRERQAQDLSDAQEWLWDAVISELEYRWRQTRPTWKRCTCELCIPTDAFPTTHGEAPF